MCKSNGKPTEAERVRLEARKWRGAKADDWDKPDIKDAADVLVGDSENTVFASVLTDRNKKLVLTVPVWPRLAPIGRNDKLTVEHIFGTVRETIHTDNYNQSDLADFPLEIELDKHSEAYGDGTHKFQCKVELYNFEENQSGELSLRFDRVAPHEGNIPKNSLPLPTSSTPMWAL